MFFRSVRFKIVLLYMLVLTLALSFFSFVLYQDFRKKLFENVDDVLQSRAEGVADSIDAYWRAEWAEVPEKDRARPTLSKIDNINFAKIAKRWVEEKSRDPRLVGIIIRIYDANGVLIASSKNISQVASFPSEAFGRIRQGYSHFDNLSAEFRPGRLEALREFSLPVVENNKVAYIVRVASPLSAVYNAIKNLRFILFALLPVTVLLMGILGTLLAKVALGPVDRIIKTIHQITAENLALRVTIPDTKDEIKRLADTFNEMLSRLEGAFTSQRQFIEDLAHELRTPLSVMKGELEVTLKKIRSSQEYETILQSSLEEVDRISSIVADLLMLARFESRSITVEKKPCALGAVAERVVRDISVLAQQKEIALGLALEEDSVIFGDEENLGRLLRNLVDNAVKYTPRHGRVDVRVTRDGQRAGLIVRDTGIGIAPDDLPHIFDRFYRVDKSRSEPGYGLGLSIARSIATAHHGEIRVVSTPGQGSTFSVSLPVIAH